MQALKAIQPFSDGKSLAAQSERDLKEDLVFRLAELMDQAQAFHPNQTIPPGGTVEAWLRAWEQLVAEYGEQRFTEALWRACRRSDFLPSPKQIEEECQPQRKSNFDTIRQLSEEAKQRQANPGAYIQIHSDPEWQALIAKAGGSKQVITNADGRKRTCAPEK